MSRPIEPSNAVRTTAHPVDRATGAAATTAGAREVPTSPTSAKVYGAGVHQASALPPRDSRTPQPSGFGPRGYTTLARHESARAAYGAAGGDVGALDGALPAEMTRGGWSVCVTHPTNVHGRRTYYYAHVGPARIAAAAGAHVPAVPWYGVQRAAVDQWRAQREEEDSEVAPEEGARAAEEACEGDGDVEGVDWAAFGEVEVEVVEEEEMEVEAMQDEARQHGRVGPPQAEAGCEEAASGAEASAGGVETSAGCGEEATCGREGYVPRKRARLTPPAAISACHSVAACDRLSVWWDGDQKWYHGVVAQVGLLWPWSEP